MCDVFYLLCKDGTAESAGIVPKMCYYITQSGVLCLDGPEREPGDEVQVCTD